MAALVVALAGATCIDGAAERTAAIAAAPPFTTSELAQPAATNWPTNGGSTTNDRYSTLGQIDTANVHALKGVTLTHVRDSGVGPLFSGESQPVVYDGVIYVSTGADDVFAVSAVTGKILWQYRAHLDPKISTVCCGWLNRGVAVGGGRVYIGQLNGKVVALTQATGKVAWSRQLVRWQDGQTITGAPLYLAGRLYVGVVGGNFGARGLLQAFDALTGAEVWRFYSVPGPGQPGHDTWPQGSSAYLRGGGGIWSTPAVDPALGLIYVTTGNPGDDWFGGLRPGKDLYTSSVVALDLATGKVKWYFQEVHHDIWDYDSASPPILFDVTLHGRTVQGIGAAGKTGWLYLLDRATGKPLYGILERPVPQNAAQKTWPTQPIPLTGAFVPHGRPSAAGIARVEQQRSGTAATVPVQIADRTFTPIPTSKLLIYTPGDQGGNSWPPPSYDPQTGLFYVCATVSTVGGMGANTPYQRGQPYVGVGAIAGNGFWEGTGTLTALAAGSGRIVWQRQWAHPCYSGTVTTAGDLVFAGQNAGQLQAYNARTGKLLWSFQTGAGANDTPAVYELDGLEYVAFLAGGSSTAVTAHGDDLWTFALGGTLGPVKPGKITAVIR